MVLLALLFCNRNASYILIVKQAVRLLRLAWIVVSVALSATNTWNADGWLLQWAINVSCILNLVYPDFYMNSVVAWACNVSGAAVLLGLKWELEAADVGKCLSGVLICAIISNKISRLRESNKRRNWRLLRILLQESKQMQTVVHNLLPKEIAATMCQKLLKDQDTETQKRPHESSCGTDDLKIVGRQDSGLVNPNGFFVCDDTDSSENSAQSLRSVGDGGE